MNKLPSLSRQKRFLDIGFDRATGKRIELSHKVLETSLWLLGPPGTGKTRELLHLFQQLTRVPHASIFLFNPKGDLSYMARDLAIAHGLTSRLDWFSPGDQNVMGYDPLRPNGLAVSIYAKQVLEGVRAAWGQSSFDETAQMPRALYVALV